MAIDRLDFDNLDENDLNELVTTDTSEGLRTEYKRDLYGSSDSDKREALKDVSALANAFGGHLVIGIEEENGLPVSIRGISNVNPDEVILRLEQIVRTGIEPRIQGIRMRPVPLASGAYCFVLRVPRSWNPPHRVSAQNSNRFWIRNTGGTHEASIEELRTLFTLGVDAFDRVHHFRDERLGEILSGRGARPLQPDGRLIVHCVPLAAVTSRWEVDLHKVFQIHQAFTPIGVTTGMTPRFNFEGFINERGGEHNFGYTQVFRNGALEATNARIVQERDGLRYIHARTFERKIFDVLPAYINGLRDLGIPPPILILLTLEGVQDVTYEVREDMFDEFEPPIDRPILFLPDSIINEYGANLDYLRATKPAFDALWNTAGRVAAQTFSDDGTWTGNIHRH